MLGLENTATSAWGRQGALYNGEEVVVRMGAGVWRKETSLPKGDEKDTQLRGPGFVGAAVVKSESETTS